MKIISVRQNPEYKERAIKYFQDSWSEISPLFMKIVFQTVLMAHNLYLNGTY